MVLKGVDRVHSWFESDLHHFIILTNYLVLLFKEALKISTESGNLTGIEDLTYKTVHCFVSDHCHGKEEFSHDVLSSPFNSTESR